MVTFVVHLHGILNKHMFARGLRGSVPLKIYSLVHIYIGTHRSNR